MTSSSNSSKSVWQLESFRSIDDFLIGSARFSVPNFGDLEKWNNRITNNFLYYQTNYFALGLIVLTLFGLFNFGQTLFICSLLTTIGTIIFLCYGGQLSALQQLDFFATANLVNNRGRIVPGTIAIGLFMLWLQSAVCNMLLIVLLPVFFSFLHASFRMRNVNNKMTNLLYQRSRTTPMGKLLTALDRFGIEEFVER